MLVGKIAADTPQPRPHLEGFAAAAAGEKSSAEEGAVAAETRSAEEGAVAGSELEKQWSRQRREEQGLRSPSEEREIKDLIDMADA